MKIKYSPHAAERMEEREIQKSKVRQTLKNPDKILHVDRNRLVARKKLNGQSLEIIYVIEDDQIIVITLYHEKTIAKN